MKDRKLLNIELGRVSPEQYKDLPESGVCVVLDNIRSAHNVGSVSGCAESARSRRLRRFTSPRWGLSSVWIGCMRRRRWMLSGS